MPDGDHGTDLARVAVLRSQLWAAGFRPVALYSNDKCPVGDAWEKRARRNPPEAAEASPCANALNTGVLCDGLRALDIDLDDPELAARIEAEAMACFGPAPARWRDNSGRRLVYRAAEGEPPKRLLAGNLGKLEVLGRGQQFHAYGRHPSGALLRWRPAPLEATPPHMLPAVSEDQITALLTTAAPWIEAKASKAEQAEKRQEQRRPEAHAAPAEVAEVLARIPNSGPADWDRFNLVGMAIFAALGGADAGLALFRDWASRNPAYDAAEVEGRWANYHRSPPSRTGLHTLRAMAAEAAPWPEPAMGVLHRSTARAPDLPLDVFGTFWAGWIGRTAEGANAPPDYIAMPLLAVASALLGNARWASAWPSWAEPSALWCGSLGNLSSGKSSGASTVTRDVLRLVEAHMGRDYPAEVQRWQEVEAVTRAALKQWEKDVARALKAGEPVPAKPEAATIPPKPIRPRASVTDATVESIGPLLAGLPKGVLNLRDEMAGWLLNLSRYSNGGTNRPFWLEAYNGGPYQIDRQKYPVPLFIPHLILPAFGTIQPERLADILGGADDGLASRFLWAGPEATRRFGRPRDAGDAFQATAALQRLADLSMAKNENGDPVPSYVRLADDAQPVLIDFAREMQDREAAAHGLLKSSIGKARARRSGWRWCWNICGGPRAAGPSRSASRSEPWRPPPG